MGDAARVIDWNGTDVPAGVVELLAELPPGRYRLAAVADDGDEFELTPEQEEGIRAGMRSIAAGRTVTIEEADARMRARIAAARPR